MADNRTREIIGFNLPMDYYEKAERNMVLERKHLNLSSAVTTREYLQAVLRDAIDQRTAGLKKIDQNTRLVLSPDELQA